MAGKRAPSRRIVRRHPAPPAGRVAAGSRPTAPSDRTSIAPDIAQQLTGRTCTSWREHAGHRETLPAWPLGRAQRRVRSHVQPQVILQPSGPGPGRLRGPVLDGRAAGWRASVPQRCRAAQGFPHVDGRHGWSQDEPVRLGQAAGGRRSRRHGRLADTTPPPLIRGPLLLQTHLCHQPPAAQGDQGRGGGLEL